MARYIYKFGGSSVADIDCIKAVASRIAEAKKAGDEIIVVLSAMGGETDRLIQLAQALNQTPNARAYDALLSTGEQVSCSLLSVALQEYGLTSHPYAGWQIKLKTNSAHKKARIESIDSRRLEADLAAGVIPIVCGFQGIDKDGVITTLGRGGSDTTAVALAAILKADECKIFTDVEGVYTADPRIVSDARRLKCVTFEEMLELASLGAKVLQTRAVEFAGKYNVPLRVLSSFSKDAEGTLITYEDPTMEQAIVSGIAIDRNQAKITLNGVPHQADIAGRIMSTVSEANIDVDMIVQNVPNQDGLIDMSFTVGRDDFNETVGLMKALATEVSAKAVNADKKVAKLSVVGVGMRSHAGVATTMFAALAKEGVVMHLIATSEIKISVVVDEKYIELGARALHTAFNLNAKD